VDGIVFEPIGINHDYLLPEIEAGPFSIISRFTLTKLAKKLEVRSTMRNTARNHRLRVAFPTGIKSSTAASSGA
jgi:alpha-mannosidase